MPENYDDLEQPIDEQVIVKPTDDDKIVGTLRTYSEDFALTLTEAGQPTTFKSAI